jgi:hypothetical protein
MYRSAIAAYLKLALLWFLEVPEKGESRVKRIVWSCREAAQAGSISQLPNLNEHFFVVLSTGAGGFAFGAGGAENSKASVYSSNDSLDPANGTQDSCLQDFTGGFNFAHGVTHKFIHAEGVKAGALHNFTRGISHL